MSSLKTRGSSPHSNYNNIIPENFKKSNGSDKKSSEKLKKEIENGRRSALLENESEKSEVEKTVEAADGTAVKAKAEYTNAKVLKRIQSWLNVNRLQLPLHNLDSDSITSIPQKSEKSNISDKKSSKKLKKEIENGRRSAILGENADKRGLKGKAFVILPKSD